MEAIMSDRVADRIRVLWCQSCDAYHVLLYHNLANDNEPFAMCTLQPEAMCNIIDADFGAVVDYPIAMMMHQRGLHECSRPRSTRQ